MLVFWLFRLKVGQKPDMPKSKNSIKVRLPLNTFDMNFFGIIYSKYVVWDW
jgi:hypothetical protein